MTFRDDRRAKLKSDKDSQKLHEEILATLKRPKLMHLSAALARDEIIKDLKYHLDQRDQHVALLLFFEY
jgi:hypothetical protein